MKYLRYLSWVKVHATRDKVLDDGANRSVQAILASGILAPILDIPVGWNDFVPLLNHLLMLFLEEKVAVALDSQILTASLFQAAKGTAFSTKELVMMIKILFIWPKFFTVRPMTPAV